MYLLYHYCSVVELLQFDLAPTRATKCAVCGSSTLDLCGLTVFRKTKCCKKLSAAELNETTKKFLLRSNGTGAGLANNGSGFIKITGSATLKKSPARMFALYQIYSLLCCSWDFTFSHMKIIDFSRGGIWFSLRVLVRNIKNFHFRCKIYRTRYGLICPGTG